MTHYTSKRGYFLQSFSPWMSRRKPCRTATLPGRAGGVGDVLPELKRPALGDLGAEAPITLNSRHNLAEFLHDFVPVKRIENCS